MDIPDDARGGETLGNPNCRVVVSLEKVVEKKHGNRETITLKRIILHNPETQIYCVMVYSKTKQELNLVSWHNAPEEYGREKWALAKKE